MSLIVICEILGLLLNTLTANHKDFLPNSESLVKLIQSQFSKKEKNISQFFAAFLKSSPNFILFEKKDERHRLRILKVRTSERRD